MKTNQKKGGAGMKEVNPSVLEPSSRRSQTNIKEKPSGRAKESSAKNPITPPPTEAKVEDKHLVGTFTSVLIIGAFLIVTWFGVYALYLSRL